MSACELPWKEKTLDDYEDACTASEFVGLALHPLISALLLGSMTFQKEDTHGGRLVHAKLPTSGLQQRDRLDLTPTTMSLATTDRTTQFRRQNNITTSRSNGTHSFHNVPTSHCMHLGVFQSLITHAMWQLIDVYVWDVGEMLPTRDLHPRQRLRSSSRLISGTRKKEKLRGPMHPLHVLHDFSIRTMGTRSSPVLRAKAAQSGDVSESSLITCCRSTARV